MSRKPAHRRHRSRPLTILEDRFIAEYLVDLEAGPALRRAGSQAKFADQQGYEMLRKPHIAAEIQRRLAALNEKAAVNRQWVLNELVLQYRAATAAAGMQKGGKRNTAEARLAIDALEKLGKHVDVNAFRQQIGLGNPDGSDFDFSGLSDDKLGLLEELLAEAALAGGGSSGDGPSLQ